MNEKKMTKRYGSRITAIKSDMDKPTASTKGLDDAVSKIGAKTKQGMSDAGSFGSAFKAARSSGDKTFTWHGRSYNTKLASAKPAAAKPAAAKPAAAKPAAAKPAAAKPAAPSYAGPMKSGLKPAAAKPAAPSYAGPMKSGLKPAAPARKKYTAADFGMAKGGSIDGCAVRGKTKAR